MWLGGITRREHLSRIPLQQALRERLSHAQRRELEQLAPAELVVPSGSHVPIDYLDESAPSVSVRLQEVFGLALTPRIGGGAVPITFKLLSPARRPVQVTRDLAGFWGSSYALVRKEMRGRYPKHTGRRTHLRPRRAAASSVAEWQRPGADQAAGLSSPSAPSADCTAGRALTRSMKLRRFGHGVRSI